MGNKLINVRGTNGSGKSTLMRKFIGENPRLIDFEINGRKVKVLHNQADKRFILGDYTRDCGGLDTTKNLDEVRGLVKEFIAKGDVFMEGMMYSTLFSSSLAIDEEIAKEGHQYYWVQIDIDPQVCIDSTVERRIRNENFNAFDPILLVKKWRAINNAFNKAVDAGRLCYAGDRDECAAAIRNALGGYNNVFQTGKKVNADIDLKAYPEIVVTKEMIEKFCPKAENNVFGFFG